VEVCTRGRQHKRAILDGLQCREAAYCSGDDDDDDDDDDDV